MTKADNRIWTAEVHGSGPFPMDMLRYDGCVPSTETDSYEILNSMEQSYERIFKVKVTGRGISGPTSQRWASFSWHVKSNDALIQR